MKSIRSLIILIPTIVVLAAIVGFFITFSSSPQAAYARIFIDLGVMIALISACMTLPKPRELRTEEIVDALRELVRGRYDKRLASNDFDELSDIAQAFNELAGSLSDSGDPTVNGIRYHQLRRHESAPKPIINEFHSHHPELGPVQPAQTDVENTTNDTSTSMPPYPHTSQAPEPILRAPTTHLDLQNAALSEQKATFSSKNELDELYEYFCAAHHQQSQEPIDFETFKNTIEKARADLLSAHQCRAIRFEIVMEGGEVALRPRLVR